MRPRRFIGAHPLEVSAAHSRIVAPGDVVDFDEVIRPRDGDNYSMEVALGVDAQRFEPVTHATSDDSTMEAAAPVAPEEPAAPVAPEEPAAGPESVLAGEASAGAETQPAVTPKPAKALKASKPAKAAKDLE